MKKIFSLLVLVLFSFSSPTVADEVDIEKQLIGIVGAVTGTVKTETRDLKAGDKIYLNETILAGVDSGTQILLLDQSTFTIGSDSEVVMDTFIYDPATSEGKIVSIVKVQNIVKGKNEEVGNKLAMHVAASSPLAIDKDGLSKEVLEKELEIIKAELLNSGKKKEMIEKISQGKLNKFISDNTLLNQIWIMDPKKKVLDILKANSINSELKILVFVIYKVGEGV